MLKALVVSVAIIATPAHSDILGIADGQAFAPTQFQELTLDLAGRTQADSQRFGIRITLPRFLDHYALFVEAGSSQGEWEDLAINGKTEFSGSGNGAGLYFKGIPDWKNFSTTLKFSFYNEENNVDTPIVVSGRVASVDQDKRQVSAKALFSPTDPISAKGLNAYVALGLVSTRSSRAVFVDQQEEARLARSDSYVNAYLAAGVVYPMNRFRLYAVAEVQEEVSLSMGIRWHFTKTTKKAAL